MGESLKINFPDKTQHEFELGKPVVILGANGAGKTRFTVKLEEMNDTSFIHSLSPSKLYYEQLK